jgi:hypothetical protein
MNFKHILTGILTIGVLMSVAERKAIAQPDAPVQLAQSLNNSVTWVKFTSRQRGFEVVIPGNYKIDDRLAGKQRWSITGSDLDTYYDVTYFEGKNVDVDQFVNAFFKGSSKFTEIDRSPLTIRGYAGRESNFRFSGGGNGRVRFFSVRNRLYMIWVINPEPNEKKVAGFLDSFGLF